MEALRLTFDFFLIVFLELMGEVLLEFIFVRVGFLALIFDWVAFSFLVEDIFNQ